jgi:RNA polymerase sigma factor (sigma-70 family)
VDTPSTASKPTPGADQSRWFAEEVAPHEPTLRGYLRKEFPKLTDLDDVVQESYLRLLRARIAGRLRSAPGFLFTAARHVALDLIRRRKRAGLEAISAGDEARFFDDGLEVAESVSRTQELELLGQAIESLPLRCRQVLKLQKIYGLSHKEIAAQLHISERTVNVQVGKGVRRCARFMEAHGMKIAPIYQLDSALPKHAE